MAVSDFALDILGTSFTIRVDEEPAYLEEILGQYRASVENTGKMFNLKDPLVTAILTGFILSEELHKEKNSIRQGAARLDEAREAEELALSIIARIDRVLEDNTPGNS
jgi:cell division protein ZapA